MCSHKTAADILKTFFFIPTVSLSICNRDWSRGVQTFKFSITLDNEDTRKRNQMFSLVVVGGSERLEDVVKTIEKTK